MYYCSERYNVRNCLFCPKIVKSRFILLTSVVEQKTRNAQHEQRLLSDVSWLLCVFTGNFCIPVHLRGTRVLIVTYLVFDCFCVFQSVYINIENMEKKKKSGRFQVECLSCGSTFNRDYKNSHEKNCHSGNIVRIKNVGAPENPFVQAAKRKKSSDCSETLEKGKIFSSKWKLWFLFGDRS